MRNINNDGLRPLSRHENALIVSILERYEQIIAEIRSLESAYERSAYAACSLEGSMVSGGESLPIQERILLQQEGDPRLRMLKDFVHATEKALNSLLQEEREVVNLMYFHSFKACEIAARMGMVPRSVWRYRNKAFSRLGVHLFPVIARYDWR